MAAAGTNVCGLPGIQQHAHACLSSAQVPYRLLKSFHKIQQRLVRELEKKFSGKDVVIIANRRIMAPTTSGQSNARPRSRTLTAVHEETLLDLCYPTGGCKAIQAPPQYYLSK
jgi:Ribosomal protein S7e